jgi:hypothetical protein
MKGERFTRSDRNTNAEKLQYGEGGGIFTFTFVYYGLGVGGLDRPFKEEG